MIFPSIRIEGAILSPDILEKLEEIPGQRSVDFGLDPSVKVKDEIARAWADAQDYWRIFNRKLETLKKESPATTETRNLWVVPLLGLLGYQLEFEAKSIELNAKLYPISHRIANRGGAAIHITGSNEPAGLDRKPEKAALRMSAHAMLQEYLNLTEQLYGIVTNGRVLRLLRDSSRLVKLTYLECDLDRIFTDGLFADFAVLYRLLHVTRLPASCEAPEESLIEKYHQDSLDSGARIREGLSSAVEKTILSFANGFLSNSENAALLAAITSGQIKPAEYYHYLLRLIYRILFLMVIEERNLVYPQSPVAPKRDIYDTYYSLMRLRRLSEKRYLADRRHHDHWLALMATFHLFEDGGPGGNLGIAPLAGDLFRADAIGPLNHCSLDNETLLHCLRSLSLYENQKSGQLIRVNYAALNVEEFGSVYEGLLEYEPVFLYNDNAIEFAFARGDQRAATGSHYTPDDLVQPLIKHSLDYLIADKLKTSNPEEALLSLRVADISCGSGHILLAAARRIATELAIVRTGEEQPSPSAFRSAIRDVIRNCIYGVDLNPLAVELCKVALWLEAHIPGQPLNFLDHHIKCGNAIVGFAHREEMQKGVPDQAFVTMPGDDKEVVAELRKRNKAERIRQGKQVSFAFTPEIDQSFSLSLKQWHEIASLPERTPSEIEEKKRRYQEFATGKDSRLLHQIASIPIAQFYIEKTYGNRSSIITDDEYSQYLSGQQSPNEQATAMVQAIAERKNFFHWFLEFPEIIENGGFDCILGNPPFLGGQKLSGTYGLAQLEYLKHAYAPIGAVDLVTYFFRRIFTLIKDKGFQSLISTNTIAQGSAREGGLDVIVGQGGTINHAVRSLKWPGIAAVEVALVTISKQQWKGKFILAGKEVSTITPYLDDASTLGNPLPLKQNEGKSFQGSIVLGKGFVLEPQQAEALIRKNPKNRDVLFPYLNGDDLNTNPDQAPSRWVINFFDWSEEKCRNEYPDCYSILERLVKPERKRWKKDKADNDIVGEYALRKPLPQKWWIYGEKRPALYRVIAKEDRVLVACRVAKYVNHTFFAPDSVFGHANTVVARSNFSHHTYLQSSLHSEWAWKYASTLESRISLNVDCIDTFPFPQNLTQSQEEQLERLGESYHEYRKQLMLDIQLGLTKSYNLFHAQPLRPMASEEEQLDDKALQKLLGKDAVHLRKHLAKTPGTITFNEAVSAIQKLRNLHHQMDNAVLEAYGWSDINLRHDFYEVEYLPENDRVRYTIHPAARREILKRLLALNHQIHAQEVADGLWDKKGARGKAEKQQDGQMGLNL
ncbi:MAG: restriction endonuclease [Chlorobium phaeobacteroides]|uniref:site-specific DNA-methyltransferase (adenine-specific) n=1 Tax=Chlorobium phaeobacteroides (strain BS1) TaxID=331678 RepID=B3EPF4_CHLPB|nr:restriction endonuclease [Chlorobium phaeobacteroides]